MFNIKKKKHTLPSTKSIQKTYQPKKKNLSKKKPTYSN